ncbi:hypothetical protein GM418_23935 [Maribellus comscasis]|uniref:Uncharacterized protein n=1 Tax=Maribellus comscasis TaxID=2681766 RepID=A0A6I6K278_9BACT|nr:hypothetical protein [Maribellus comscasis]QGY46597.1 hypothetical protein GM418_23935 [Maribellus comscasis]
MRLCRNGLPSEGEGGRGRESSCYPVYFPALQAFAMALDQFDDPSCGKFSIKPNLSFSDLFRILLNGQPGTSSPNEQERKRTQSRILLSVDFFMCNTKRQSEENKKNTR